MIRRFKNKRTAGANGLLGEGGKDSHSAKRELREGRGGQGERVHLHHAQ